MTTTPAATRERHVSDAADALKDLNMFHAIIGLTEGSLISSEYESTLSRIRDLCHAASARCLRAYDKEVAAAIREKP